MFDPGLKINQVLSNRDIVDLFQCGNMGGMRRSHTTNTLVIISDYTKGLYHDKWIGGVLHYTGMGQTGNQDIDWAQNATLANCASNDVDVHLFEVIDPGEYIYCGIIELVDKPYTETQPDEQGKDRLVWMFPVKPVTDEDVKKPEIFVFKNDEDFKKNGDKAEKEYIIWRSKRLNKSSALKGKYIEHKTYGVGMITNYDGRIITVKFEKEGNRTLNYQICLDNELIWFV